MTRGDTGSQGENTGVDKEWRGEEDVVVCLGSWLFETLTDIETKYMLYQRLIALIFAFFFYSALYK